MRHLARTMAIIAGCIAHLAVARADDSPPAHLVFVSANGVVSIRLLPAEGNVGSRFSFQSSRFGDSKSLKLEDSLRKRFDANGDGQVSADEFRLAETLLKSLDFDEDECLAPLEIAPELLTQPVIASQAGQVQNGTALLVRTAEDVGELNELLMAHQQSTAKPLEQPDVTLIVQPNQTHILQIDPAKNSTISVSVDQPVGASRIRLRKANVELELWGDFSSPRPGVNSKDPQQELAIHVRPGRRGWFEWIDSDRDGRLSRPELRRSQQAVAAAQAATSDATGPSFSVRIGPPGKLQRTWIPLIGSNSSDDAETSSQPWFAAMDRNSDGQVSIDEFLGGDELFRKFDRDGDGLLSVSEAAEVTSATK